MAIKHDEVLFSVLIISIPSRIEKLSKLYDFLIKQIGDLPVEVLCLIDNKAMTIGEKRNRMLQTARGKYLAFLDDDDMVSDDYISSIIYAIQNYPESDVVAFNQHCTVNGKEFMVDFDLNNNNEPAIMDANGNYHNIRRKPFHMCVWRSIIAKNTPFQDISYGEDLAWIINLSMRCKKQYKINKVLHYYRYDDRTSESIQFRNNNG
jgi:glycosyltransferase involved in cell wall biosynthesis